MRQILLVIHLWVVCAALLLGSVRPSFAETGEPAAVLFEKDTVHMSNLKQLSPEAQKAYDELPWPAKQMLAKKLQEDTTLIPGVLSVNHKKAFIKGRAVGKNVFDFMKSHVDKMIADGQIKAEWGPAVHKFFEAARGLTPDQRAAWIELICHDVHLSGG